MAKMEVKSLDRADERRRFRANGELDIMRVGGVPIGVGRFEPGWRWSSDVKPLAGTDSCMAEHVGYCVSGRMRIRMNDGSEQEIGPGDSFYIPPGHDGWVVGEDACQLLDFVGYENYAQPRGAVGGGRTAAYDEQPSIH